MRQDAVAKFPLKLDLQSLSNVSVVEPVHLHLYLHSAFLADSALDLELDIDTGY
jgi:hypothetical protein